MKTAYGHLTYCTNVHPGEDWAAHFSELQKHLPAIKERVSPQAPFGIGLRLSNAASIELSKQENLSAFKTWMGDDFYVFTMNGFPYGAFHQTKVKDHVHTPDWTTKERSGYTIRLAQVLAELLPEGQEGSISTSPLSYKLWHRAEDYPSVFKKATAEVLRVVQSLIDLKNITGKTIHIALEPEPDGLMETVPEFITWYQNYLLPLGKSSLQQSGYSAAEAETLLKEYVRLCYDVCHLAVGYEDHMGVLKSLKELGIRTGKIQISAALKAQLPAAATDREMITTAFKQFNESTYLHQVIARQQDGNLKRYPDLPQALADANNSAVQEWRAHFHVPIFLQDYGVLKSTQQDIETVLKLHKAAPFSTHLEVETYTWDVLPESLKLPIGESVTRELEWVMERLNNQL
jgi:hypothetical protein